MLFLLPSRRFVDQAMKAKKIRVAVTVYQHGVNVFEFSTPTSLAWDVAKSPARADDVSKPPAKAISATEARSIAVRKCTDMAVKAGADWSASVAKCVEQQD